jgi:putative flippase GtrA
LSPERSQVVQRLLDRQVLRFVMVGVVNSVFGFAVFTGLQLTIGGRVHYLVVLLASHVVSVFEAYLLQRWLVFRVSGHWWLDLARFWSVYLVALGVNLVALPLLVEIAHISVLPAQALVMLGTALGTYLAHRGFTFRRPRETRAADGFAADGFASDTEAAADTETDAAQTGGTTYSPMIVSPAEGKT